MLGEGSRGDKSRWHIFFPASYFVDLALTLYGMHFASFLISSITRLQNPSFLSMDMDVVMSPEMRGFRRS